MCVCVCVCMCVCVCVCERERVCVYVASFPSSLQKWGVGIKLHYLHCPAHIYGGGVKSLCSEVNHTETST